MFPRHLVALSLALSLLVAVARGKASDPEQLQQLTADDAQPPPRPLNLLRVLSASPRQRVEDREGSANLIDVEQRVEQRNDVRLLEIIIEILEKYFKGAVKRCLQEIQDICQDQWENPIELLVCAVSVIKENGGKCIVGTRM